MKDIEDTGEAQVTFTKSEVTTTWLASDNLSILELAEREGLKPLYGCRSAMCGSCEVKILRGQVYGAEGDKPQGILICQSRPATSEINRTSASDIDPIHGMTSYRQVKDPMASIQGLDGIECGEQAAKHFLFDQGYINLNHGSYGTYPREVQAVLRYYQERTEARPDAFVRYEYRTHLLDRSREAIAKYLDVPVDTCVLAVNASTCFDTIIHNFSFSPGDVIVCFSSIYGSFDNTLIYKSQTTALEIHKIQYTNPISDDALCELFKNAIELLRARNKNIRLAVFDTCNTLPGVRMPFERLTQICRIHGILSCIDGAHGVGQFPLALNDLDPDFFCSNLHKWLHVPRACAVLYVPERNQHLLRATLPTAFSFVPSTNPDAVKDGFVANFAYVGTLDDSPYLCIQAALEWRSKLAWNGKTGEAAIMGYTQDLARRGGRKVAGMLGTNVLDNEEGTLSECSMTNVRLPLDLADIGHNNPQAAELVAAWIMKTMTLEYEVAVNVFAYDHAIWVRLCAQIYNTMDDFERAANCLRDVCERARKGEWRA